MTKVCFVVHDYGQADPEFPLGIGYMAASLKKAGHDVKIISADVYHYSDEQVAQMIKDYRPEIIGLGFLVAYFTRRIVPLCKAINAVKGDAFLVLGGHCPSAIPEYVLRKTQADIVVIGDGEETIVELADNVVKLRLALPAIEGIEYRDCDDKVWTNKPRSPVKDLDKLPFPEWSLFPMDIYTTNNIYPLQDKSEKSFQILISRGCTSECSFCMRLSKGVRFRSVDNVIEEIKLLYERYGVTYFEINDELFVCGKKRLQEFAEAFAKLPFKIKFYCQSRVDGLDLETIKLLKSMGCVKLNIGFESQDDTVLKAMNKHTSAKMNDDVARMCKETGLNMGINVIWGHPCDSAESLRKNVEFVKKYTDYQELRNLRFVTPYPRCDLFELAIKKGLIKDEDDFFDKFKSSDLLTVNFLSLPDRTLYKMMFRANRELILDYQRHRPDLMTPEQAQELIKRFDDLYFQQKFEDFVGVRHKSA